MKKIGTVLFWAATAYCQSEAHWVLLPASAAQEVTDQCSREAPKVEGGWSPSAGDISGLERNLFRVAGLQNGTPSRHRHIPFPENYYRQYVGIVVAGHRFIYVNAGTEQLTGRARKHVSIVCDGGSSFWGALYDPATGVFSDLESNVDF